MLTLQTKVRKIFLRVDYKFIKNPIEMIIMIIQIKTKKDSIYNKNKTYINVGDWVNRNNMCYALIDENGVNFYRYEV